MTVTELISRVTLRGLAAILGVAAAAGWLAGPSAAAGATAGGVIALLNFRWLARGAASAIGGGRSLGLAGLGLRYAGTFGALALATGWTHPLAVIAGLSVLPPVLIAVGVRSSG